MTYEVPNYPIAGVRVFKNLRIPVSGGCSLASDLYAPATWSPAGGTPLPVVMDYIPYRKDDVQPGALYYETLAVSGYVVARVDTRGTGGSTGHASDEYSPEEQLDGREAVEWIASQPWCDGHVNIMGISYGGFTALQVAALAPPHLTSVVPVDFTDDRYTDDCHFAGGLMRMYYDAGYYGNVMVATNALPPASEWLADGWRAIWEEHLEKNEPYILTWLKNQTDGPYWRSGSVGDIAGQIQCPVFMISGWRDGYTNPPFRLWEKLQVPRKLLIGPWNHSYPDRGVPGPRIDFLSEVVRWLDHWCKGAANGVMEEPPIAVFMQRYDPPDPGRLESSGEWRAELEWPIPGADERPIYLGPGGTLLDAAAGDARESLRYVTEVGLTAGLWSGGVPFGLPGDQRVDEAYSVCFTSPPLGDDLAVLGRPRAILHLESTASVIGFVVSLAEVGPDGSSQLVGKGAMNVSRRESFVDPQPLVPGEVVELEVPLPCTGWIFTKGNRIRVSVANADFPNLWPTPQLATSVVYLGHSRPSRLVIPVVPVEGSAKAPEFAPSTIAVKNWAESEPNAWQVEKDVLTGQTRVRAAFGRLSGRVEFCCEVNPKDPAQASVSGRVQVLRAMPEGDVEAISDLVLRSTKTHFEIAIDLSVAVAGQPHSSRHWAESIERRLL